MNLAVTLRHGWNKEAWAAVRELLATRQHSNPEPIDDDA